MKAEADSYAKSAAASEEGEGEAKVTHNSQITIYD